MFIDERGNLQFDSIEELKANKELAIAEIDQWIVPSIEEIELQIIEGIEASLDTLEAYNVETTFGETPDEIVKTLISIMKIAIEMGMKIIAEEINIDSITLKYNDYTNRFYIACDRVQQQLAA